MKNITEEKKQPWFKRAWKKVKEWWYYNDESVLMFIWGALAGLWCIFIGWVLGISDEKNNKNNYDAGRRAGSREGYLDAMQDLKDSGYQVYGGYNEDCGKLIVTKLVEETITAEEKAE